MNAMVHTKLPAWLNRLIASKPKQMAQPRCECGRFCAKEHKPDITDKLVSDMSAAGLYVPAKFRNREVQKSIDSIAGRTA